MGYTLDMKRLPTGGYMTIAERIADEYTQSLDLGNLTKVQCWVLHGIKSVAMGDWARAELARMKGLAS